MNDLNKTGYILGIVSVVIFAVCTTWGALFLSIELKELHFQFLQIAYPGFGYTIIGYTIGLVESFIYGWFIGSFFAWLHKKACCKNK